MHPASLQLQTTTGSLKGSTLCLRPVCRLLLLLTFLSPVWAYATELAFFTHSSNEQTFRESNQLRGKPHAGKRAYYIELIREMMAIKGVTGTIADVPFGRGKTKVQTEDNIAFFAMARTPEREDSVKWVIPLMETTVNLYELKQSPSKIKTIEEARSVRTIGVLRGGVHEASLRLMGFTNVYPVDSYSQVLSMLRLGRLSLIASSGDFSEYVVEERHFDDLNNTGIPITNYKTYLTFSKNVSDDEVLKWRQAYRQLEISGELATLKDRYLLAANTL